MKQQLIFIGGPMGVGKTSVARVLLERLDNSIWLDGDDIWCNMNPWRVDDVTTSMAEHNIACVLRGLLQAGFDHAILSWVLHRDDIARRLKESIDDLDFDFFSFTLVCDEATLRDRTIECDGDDSAVGLGLNRLAQTKALKKTTIIDTTDMSIEETGEKIAGMLAESGRTG
jgi:predicted kinase